MHGTVRRTRREKRAWKKEEFKKVVDWWRRLRRSSSAPIVQTRFTGSTTSIDEHETPEKAFDLALVELSFKKPKGGAK